jgi:hypothetical protein
MIKIILGIFGTLCISIIFSWFYSPYIKELILELNPLFSLIASLLALTIFLQFYYEFNKAKNERKEKIAEGKAKMNSKMVALGSEIINNIQLCNLFESDKERHLQGVEVPNVYFEHSVSENMIINGEITFHKLRSELGSLSTQMKSLNSLINSQKQLMIFKGFAPIERRVDLTQSTINSMRLLHSKIPLIKKQLIEIEPLFKEQWDNPKKYIEENYLKDKMLTDALIR